MQDQRRMIGMAVDRYLINIGHKQLFATQATKTKDLKCWCLEKVEATFPDACRVENNNLSLDKALEWITDLNKENPGCSAQQCQEKVLKNTPAGMIIGIW